MVLLEHPNKENARCKGGRFMLKTSFGDTSHWYVYYCGENGGVSPLCLVSRLATVVRQWNKNYSSEKFYIAPPLLSVLMLSYVLYGQVLFHKGDFYCLEYDLILCSAWTLTLILSKQNADSSL